MSFGTLIEILLSNNKLKDIKNEKNEMEILNWVMSCRVFKRKLEDLDPEVLSAIEGGEGTSFNLLSVPQDSSVTPLKRSGAIAPNKRDLTTYTSVVLEASMATLFIVNKEIAMGIS